jgi:hypothetical protein
MVGKSIFWVDIEYAISGFLFQKYQSDAFVFAKRVGIFQTLFFLMQGFHLG